VIRCTLAAIIKYKQTHFNYFDNVNDHIKKLGASFPARIAGTPADAGSPSKGFVAGGGNA